MKYFIFDKDITTDNINSLISSITEDCTIYFESIGGNQTASEYFIDFTERTNYKITLISGWRLGSSAFDLFFFSKTYKIVLDGCFGIMHIVSRDVNTKELLQMEDLTKFLLKDIEESNNRRWQKYVDLGIGTIYKEKYYKGEDILIDTGRMKSMADLCNYKYLEEK